MHRILDHTVYITHHHHHTSGNFKERGEKIIRNKWRMTSGFSGHNREVAHVNSQ